MVGGHTVENGVCTGGIVPDHATHRGAFRGGRVRTKHQTLFRGSRIERGKNDSRFNGGGHRFGVNPNNGIQPT